MVRREIIMEQWDRYRSGIATDNFGGSSAPRDWFEGILDHYDDRIVKLEAELDLINGENDNLTACLENMSQGLSAAEAEVERLKKENKEQIEWGDALLDAILEAVNGDCDAIEDIAAEVEE